MEFFLLKPSTVLQEWHQNHLQMTLFLVRNVYWGEKTFFFAVTVAFKFSNDYFLVFTDVKAHSEVLVWKPYFLKTDLLYPFQPCRIQHHFWWMDRVEGKPVLLKQEPHVYGGGSTLLSAETRWLSLNQQ